MLDRSLYSPLWRERGTRRLLQYPSRHPRWVRLLWVRWYCRRNRCLLVRFEGRWMPGLSKVKKVSDDVVAGWESMPTVVIPYLLPGTRPNG